MTAAEKTWTFVKDFAWETLNLFSRTRNVRIKYYVILTIIILSSIYLWNAAIPSQNLNGHSTICPFHVITGYPCPGCGTTRGLKFLFHGYLYESIMMNPFALITAIFMAVSFVWIVFDLVSGRESYIAVFRKRPHWSFFVMIIIASLANWVWNFYKGV